MARMLLESPPFAPMNTIQPSLIETLRSTEQGEIPLLARHMQRLQASAHTLGYPCPLAQIEQALLKIAHAANGHAQRLRLLLHPDGRFDTRRSPLIAPAVLPPVRLATTRLDAENKWLQHKTTYRPLYEKATIWLQTHPDYFDCIFLNQAGELCEGSRSNLYLQLDGIWYTPPLSCGVLPGIMRSVLLESGQVHERILREEEILAAHALRVSNAVHGWLDVNLQPVAC